MNKDYRDKKKEKAIERKKQQYRKMNFWKKEDTKIRRSLNKQFRRSTLKNYDEDLTIRPRDYKTYGWETW